MVAQDIAGLLSDKELRRQIDRSISRALFDGEFAMRLLADPTLVLEDQDCGSQQYLSLLSIQASTLPDFACQAQALFWAPASHTREPIEEDALPLTAAAR